MSVWEKLSFNLRYHWRQPHAFRSVMADALARSGGFRWVRFVRHGSVLQLRRNGLARQLWANPDLVLDGEAFINNYLRAGDIMVDVGANIGTHSLLAARLVTARGRVIAIEAHPGTYSALKANIALNPERNIDAHCIAVGPTSGTIRISDRPDDDWNQVGQHGAMEIQQSTLDEICLKVSRMELLKIDIEGYELPCLRGAADVLTRTQCVLLEYWEEHAKRFGYTYKEIVRLLGDRGFSGHLLDEKAGAPRVEPLNAPDRLEGLQNLVFTRDPVQLQERLKIGATMP